MVLEKSMSPGTVVNIVDETNLLENDSTDEANFRQDFGRGHVVLSSLWGSTTDEVASFFEGFTAILDTPPEATFVKESAILSSYSVNRSSRYVPTKGQWEALAGSTSRREAPINPSDGNRFITELDDGLGEAVDFRTLSGFPDEIRENPDIEPIGYTATSLRRLVRLVVDASKDNHDYDRDILPRLQCLFGRPPVFGDMWYTGTIFKMYNGDQWMSI